MKNFLTYRICLLIILLPGCTRDHLTGQQDQLIQATIWFQHSAEMRALYYQSYNWAGRELERKVSEGSEKPWAVVLDIDETVLDNSPQTAQQIVDGEPFTDAMWDEWCSLAQAQPLPGALDFTKSAAGKGVELFYISNRGNHLLGVTLQNLRAAGFPFADSSHVLLKTSTSVKDPRIEKVKETHEIALLIGDNLGDFSGMFDERSDGLVKERVDEKRDLFGTTFFLLPNPMYGSWEKPFRGEFPEETRSLKKEQLRTYRH
ncbi:MAG: 5'-nucleotidase, lipoprotein e(P4) family [Bacteroidota bacterium]